MSEIPQQLGRYRILGRLGAGAMGEVFLAEDPQIDRKLAIKTVRVAGADGGELAERRNRLLREAKAAGRLVHPNVVTLFDAGEEGGVVFLVFEYVEGVDLRDRLREPPVLTVREILRIVRQVASALAAAHQSSIIHRDVKPGNILLTRSGDAKIGDFGIAKMRDQVSDLTASGAVVGTPHYMSPEQIRGERLDGRSDLFSLGAILYETLHGARPFDGETITTVVFQILHHDPLTAIRKDLPRGLVDLFQRLLSKAKEDRFEDGNQVAAAIEILERTLPAELLDSPSQGVELPSLETAPTKVAMATPIPRPPSPPPPVGARPPATPGAATAATAQPAPPRTPAPPRPAAPPPPSAAPPPASAAGASAKSGGGAASTRRLHPGALVAIGCVGLLFVGTALGLVFAWPKLRDYVAEIRGSAPELEPATVAERNEPVAPSRVTTPSRPTPSSPAPRPLPEPSQEPSSPSEPVSEPTPRTVPTEPPNTTPASPPPRTTPAPSSPSTPRSEPRREAPAPRPETPRTVPAPEPRPAEPEPTPPVTEPEPAPAPSISFDSRLRTGRRIALHVEPEDVFVLVRGPSDQRFTLVGQVGQFDTRKRRRTPLELNDGGVQYLMLRRDGYPDHVVQLEVDDSISTETILQMRLGGASAPRRRP